MPKWFDRVSVAGADFSQASAVPSGESDGIVDVIELLTGARPLLVRAFSGFSALERLLNAVPKLDDAFGIPLDETTRVEFFFHG